jgi:hypothetical protein
MSKSNFRKAGTRLGLLADNDDDIQEILDANGSVRQVLNSGENKSKALSTSLDNNFKVGVAYHRHDRHGDYIPTTTICLYEDKIILHLH